MTTYAPQGPQSAGPASVRICSIKTSLLGTSQTSPRSLRQATETGPGTCWTKRMEGSAVRNSSTKFLSAPQPDNIDTAAADKTMVIGSDLTIFVIRAPGTAPFQRRAPSYSPTLCQSPPPPCSASIPTPRAIVSVNGVPISTCPVGAILVLRESTCPIVSCRAEPMM